MGNVRVPLYTMHYSNNGGLPTFLNNNFVGTAKEDLLLALYHTHLLTEKEITEVIHMSRNLKLPSKEKSHPAPMELT